jgi:hypothetical protein
MMTIRQCNEANAVTLSLDKAKVKHLIVSHLLKNGCNTRHEHAHGKTQEFKGLDRETNAGLGGGFWPHVWH